MLIIVEGIDRVGKTTLCEKLSKHFNIPIMKDSCVPGLGKFNNPDINVEKMQTIINFIKQVDVTIISDRFHWTELIYGALNKGYVNERVSIIEEQLVELSKKNQVAIVLVEPTNIEKSSNEHGCDLSRHNELFMDIFEETEIQHKFKCNYFQIDQAVAFVGRLLKG
jgi:thymidylate kinase